MKGSFLQTRILQSFKKDKTVLKLLYVNRLKIQTNLNVKICIVPYLLNEIGSVIWNLAMIKFLGPDGFTDKFFQEFSEEIT